jgi:flagellar motor switch protein FliN/FliY
MSGTAQAGSVNLYFKILAETFSAVLGQIAAKPCPFEIIAGGEGIPEAAESDVWMLVTAGGSLRGEQAWRFPAASALLLARTLLGETETTAVELSADHRDALAELIRQVAGRLVSEMKPAWGDVQLRVEAGGAPSWAAAITAGLRPQAENPLSLPIVLHISPAFQTALSQSPATPAPPAADPVRSGGNLDLLMDVELDLTLRFGRRRMLLREILELGPGSVIELERQVQEPVELLLDGRLLARGDVVVIEGNYGLEIREVVRRPAGERN